MCLFLTWILYPVDWFILCSPIRNAVKGFSLIDLFPGTTRSSLTNAMYRLTVKRRSPVLDYLVTFISLPFVYQGERFTYTPPQVLDSDIGGLGSCL